MNNGHRHYKTKKKQHSAKYISRDGDGKLAEPYRPTVLREWPPVDFRQDNLIEVVAYAKRESGQHDANNLTQRRGGAHLTHRLTAY